MVMDVMGVSYAAVAGAVLLGALGAPLPLGVVLAAMGALARQGHLHLSVLVVCSIGSAALGDNLGYLAGRYVLRLLPLSSMKLDRHRRAQWLLRAVERHGNLGLVIFLTRWSLTGPATLVNLLAGYRRYRWSRFAAIDLLGEAIWVAIAIAPGYLLGATWGSGIIQAAGIALLGAAICSWLCRRWLTGAGGEHAAAGQEIGERLAA